MAELRGSWGAVACVRESPRLMGQRTEPNPTSCANRSPSSLLRDVASTTGPAVYFTNNFSLSVATDVQTRVQNQPPQKPTRRL